MAGPLTRYQYEMITVSRCKGPMANAGMSTVTNISAANADLNDPLATALDEIGLPPIDRSLVTDADLLAVGPGIQARLLDLVELKTLETAYQQIMLRPQSIQWEDYKKDTGSTGLTALADYLKAKWERYLRTWGTSNAPAIAAMCDTNRNELDRSGYWPPWII